MAKLPVRGFADYTLYAMLEVFFQACGQVLSRTDVQGATQLMKASTHWLSHTHVGHAIAGGIPLEVAQASSGHESLVMTTIYVTTGKARGMKVMQAVWGE